MNILKGMKIASEYKVIRFSKICIAMISVMISKTAILIL
jgi:hypothetical protein